MIFALVEPLPNTLCNVVFVTLVLSASRDTTIPTNVKMDLNKHWSKKVTPLPFFMTPIGPMRQVSGVGPVKKPSSSGCTVSPSRAGFLLPMTPLHYDCRKYAGNWRFESPKRLRYWVWTMMTCFAILPTPSSPVWTFP